MLPALNQDQILFIKQCRFQQCHAVISNVSHFHKVLKNSFKWQILSIDADPYYLGISGNKTCLVFIPRVQILEKAPQRNLTPLPR